MSSGTLFRLAILVWMMSGATIPARSNELAAARKEIELLYARDDAARLGGQSVLEEYATPDFRVTDETGEESDLNQLKEHWQRTRADYKTLVANTAVQSVTMDGDTARAVVRVMQELTSKQSAGKYRHELVFHDHWVKIGSNWRLRRSAVVSTRVWVNDRLTADVTVRPPLEPSLRDKIVSEIRSRAVILRTVRAGAEFDDLTALDKLIGDARIVALGEATHGMAEFSRMKHRLIQYLVEKKGFTVLAFEHDWPSVETIDRFIKTGEGGATRALMTMRSETWRTEEVRDLLEWMRTYNSRLPSGGKMVSFTGFDMQDTRSAAECVIRGLSRIAPSEAVALQNLYLGTDHMSLRMFDVDPFTLEERARLRANVKDALARLEALREALLKRVTLNSYRRIRQCALIVVQGSLPGVSVRAEVANARDRAMADNVKWLAEEAFPDERIVLWAHNAHVVTAPFARDFISMGQHLRNIYGDKLRSVGFVFDRGEVLAIPFKGGHVSPSLPGLTPIKLPPAKPNSADALLSATGLPLFLLDLRAVPATTSLGRWIADPQALRNFGKFYALDDPSAAYQSTVLSKAFDALLFVKETNAAVPQK